MHKFILIILIGYRDGLGWVDFEQGGVGVAGSRGLHHNMVIIIVDYRRARSCL